MGFLNKLTRKKDISGSLEDTPLARVLNTFDLTALGVGSTLGVGIYVLAGKVSREETGPSIVLSFLIAAVASFFAGLCYAEFGARVPKAGSAYVYSYVCVGEFVAFIIGWNLVLEYIIGAASVAKGLSLNVDSLIGNKMQDFFTDIAGMDVPYLAQYPDFFAFAAVMLFTIALMFGAKESSRMNNIFTLLNLSVVTFVIIAGLTKADIKNWKLTQNDFEEWCNKSNCNKEKFDFGLGGFFPFGIEGVVKGAATCFYAFVGFDCIATTGEEAINPRKSIPLAICVSLLIIFLAYFGVSAVLTLMWPYYLQDVKAPLTTVFGEVDMEFARIIVSVGAIFALLASLFGSMFPLPRIFYAMSSDGLIFPFLGKINKKFRTPIWGTFFPGLLTGILSTIFDLGHLVNMLSIGTLTAYTIVAASVLLLRYETEHKAETNSLHFLQQFFNIKSIESPSVLSSKIVAWGVLNYFVSCLAFCMILVSSGASIITCEPWAICLLAVFGSVLIISFLSIWRQPASKINLTFKVPFVPVLPALSILINSYLMVSLDKETWIRFLVWLAIGLAIYFGYGLRNSKASKITSTQEVDGIDNKAFD